MSSFSHLRAVLLSALSSRGLQNGEQEFFEELMAQKTRLHNIYNVGPRNTQEQRELQSGRINVNGRSLAVNSDFAQQVLYVSQQLDCSERYIASLLHHVTAENPNLSQERSVEATVLEFHLRRRQLADCLRYIFEIAQGSEDADAPELYVRLGDFVRSQLLPPAVGDDRSLPLKIFTEMENLDAVLAKAQAARQNARSSATATSLSYDILSARCDSLKYERRTLATVLYQIGHMGDLSSIELPKMVDWLEIHPRHPMTLYILAAVLTMFDIMDPRSNGGKARHRLGQGEITISYMRKKLDGRSGWKEPGLKAAVLLKWTLFLTETRHRDPSLENKDGFKAEELETQIWNAVQGDCFTYLTRTVSQLQKKQSTAPPISYAAVLLAQSEQELSVEPPADDFKPAVLEVLETLVRSLITHASSELRKIKQRQEDLLLAGNRTDRSRLFRSSPFTPEATSGTEKSTPPRNDMAMLFSFIGILYSALPPERALQFWGSGPSLTGRSISYIEYVELTAGKLPSFLQWAVWSTQARDLDMTMALYDMLSGLAKGQQCSELAYNFLARGGGDIIPGSTLPTTSSHFSAGPAASWNAIFSLLDSWATAGAPRANQAPQPVAGQYGFPAGQPWQAQPPPPPPQPQPQLALTQQDVLLAQSFLRLLSTVVIYSVAVRITISGHARFRAIPTLVSLIPLGIPLEIKGAVFDTLAAFCEPGSGGPGVEICRSVWTLMERLEVINVRINYGIGSAIQAEKGMELELEEVEAIYKMYPATIPFLRLLSTLIHTPKRIPLKARVTDVEPINTIPDALGHPYRLPGVGPYTAFVVDNVFSRIASREYLRPTDRWLMNDLSLCYIERCLASYDLESLVTAVEELQLKGDDILQLAIHPGYDIMKRMLTNSPLQASILSYIVEGVDGFDKGLAEEEPYFRSTIVRVLRIVLRVLEMQDIFLDVLVPLLAEVKDTSVFGEAHPVSYFIRFDQSLSFAPTYVPAIAAYVAYPAYSELMLLSVKILTSLTSSSAFPQLATLLDQSNDSLRILEGYQNIMDDESMEDVDSAEAAAEQSTGAGAPDVDETSDLLTQAIRLAVLDLFIQNTNSSKPYPNVSHFLLFGGALVEDEIHDPHALGARRSAIHSILDLLNTGVPRLKGKNSGNISQAAPLFVTLPALAERCYHVVYQLCKHPRTSDFTMRYLRTREDFFARHLAAIPYKAPVTLQEPYIEVLYNDGSRLTTTVASLSSFLRLRSWILDLIALDLHVLTNKGHHKSVSELLELLFGSEEDSLDPEAENWESTIFKPFREVGQSHLRMIELVQSLDFDWSDSLVVQAVDLEYMGRVNLRSCVRVDDSGCEIVDRTALLSLLTTARRSLHAQGRISTQAHLDQLAAETNYILESCAVENHRREVRYAAASGYEAWKRLLDMILIKCFGRLPHDRREGLLFDLLHVLPPTLRSTNVQESTAVLLSESVLSAITKLREDRRHQIINQAAGNDPEAGSLPAERLHSLLRGILECIMDNNRIELVRGNLYASLINYLHLIMSADTTQVRVEAGSMNISSSLSFSTIRNKSQFGNSVSTLPTARGSASNNPLVSGSLAILKPAAERLMSIISRDAIDGTEVWKTVAFMLLDSLVRLSSIEKQPGIFATLSRHGFLSGFVQGLKEADTHLQAVLKPDPDDLNALYVYEGKMSLLIRMAQNRQGAERLIEARAVSILADCDYLDARPEADQAFADRDSFLPSAIQRYHQLFTPALQLVSGILVTLGTKHGTAANQVLRFLSSHRDTVVLLLKNEVEELSLAIVEEIRLLVALCAGVLPLVPRTELSSNSGFGGIHAAVSSLAAKCLGNRHWSENVKPQSDIELTNADIPAPGYGVESQFRVDVKHMDQLLRKEIIAYFGITSDFTEPDFTIVLLPIATTPRQEERSSRVLATVPTVGDAIESLNDLCKDLADTFKEIVDISAELSSKDHIRVDNIREIVNLPNIDFINSLDIRQKQSLISRELDRWRGQALGRALRILNSAEMIMLLLWRHLAFFGEGRHIDNPDLKSSVSPALRFVSTSDTGSLITEAARRLAPILQRLEDLDTHDSLSDDLHLYYVQVMSRRLKDTVGLHEDDNQEQ